MFNVYITSSCIYFFRYCKNPDVRVDLYEAIDEWVSAIPGNNKFLCGDKPNLADIVSLFLLTPENNSSFVKLLICLY